MDVVLSIAGSDSCAGAGIQADIKAIAACGGYGVTAITAVTAQNTQGVQAFAAVGCDMLRQQLDSLFADIRIAAVKTGMLATAAQVRVVVDFLQQHPVPLLVVDPVLVATSGDVLLEEDAVAVLRDELLPLARVATPNHVELAALTGCAVGDGDTLREAARQLLQAGCGAVLVTGGDAATDDAEDVLFIGDSRRSFSAPRVDTPHTHGTGCTLSAALATFLARGMDLEAAITAAKQTVTRALRAADALGHGRGPADALFALRASGAPAAAASPAPATTAAVRAREAR